jgi:hypothetical protein
MNELDELSEMIETLRARAERLRDLRASIDLFEDPYVINTSRNLSRLDTKLSAMLRTVEENALAAL